MSLVIGATVRAKLSISLIELMTTAKQYIHSSEIYVYTQWKQTSFWDAFRGKAKNKTLVVWFHFTLVFDTRFNFSPSNLLKSDYFQLGKVKNREHRGSTEWYYSHGIVLHSIKWRHGTDKRLRCVHSLFEHVETHTWILNMLIMAYNIM